MIIGNGQIASALSRYDSPKILYFASGVPNSGCVERSQFDREKRLLRESLASCDGKFVYFSSCALSASNYSLNKYYMHKLDMEKDVRDFSENYLIIRLPQVLGDFRVHPTIFNVFFDSIHSGKQFQIYEGSFRYIIDLDDVARASYAIASNSEAGLVVDITNPVRYSALQIVQAIQDSVGVAASYVTVAKDDAYIIDTSEGSRLLSSMAIDLGFGSDYLHHKVQYRVERYFASHS